MKYLYYKLWQQFKRVKTNDMPATNAMIFLTLWQGLNIFLVYIILNLYVIDISFKFTNGRNLISFALISLLTLMNYFFLYRNREKIFEKFKNENSRQSKLGNIMLLVYILGSFVFLFYFGSLLNS